MANNAYTGIANKARRVKNIYVGVNGVARKVTKAYIGVNGVARQFFASYAFVSYSGEYSKTSVTINGADYDLYTLKKSGTLKLATDARCWLCGGGAGGGSSGSGHDADYGDFDYSGGGGGGGYIAEGTLPGGTHTITIGAGGAAGSDGGNTIAGSLTANGGKTANLSAGGAGGSGGGCGALALYGSLYQSRGGAGGGVSTIPFGIASLKAHCGGGGGGAGGVSYDKRMGGNGGTNGGSGQYQDTDESFDSGTGLGGEYGGGKGGDCTTSSTGVKFTSAGNASHYGSGGGGGAYHSYNSGSVQTGGTGYQGVVYLLVEVNSSNSDDCSTFAITQQPQDVTCAVGETAYFHVEAVGEGLTYMWQIKKPTDSEWAGTSMTGNKTATLEVPGATTRDGYQYRCRVMDASGAILWTNVVTLTVTS